MGFTWKDFRKGMQIELTIASNIRLFDEVKQTHQRLAHFKSPEHLVDWLLDYESHSTDDEDDVLRSLRNLHIAGDQRSTLWLAILLLGLWPAMEWAFCRIRRLYPSDAEAAGSIWNAVCNRLVKDDLREKPRIAKRLMYAAWTNSRRHALREFAKKGQEISLDQLLRALAQADSKQEKPKRPGDEDTPHSNRAVIPAELIHAPEVFDSEKQPLDVLQNCLIHEAGLSRPDAELLIDHIVIGTKLIDLAHADGISPAAIRKRYQRAKAHLRQSASDFLQKPVTFSLSGDLGRQEGNSSFPNTTGGDA